MKKMAKIFYFSAALALLASCGNDAEPEATPDPPADETAENTETEQTDPDAPEENDNTEEGTEEEEAADEETGGSALDAYTSQEIEYARVWLQLGPNQDID